MCVAGARTQDESVSSEWETAGHDDLVEPTD